MPSMWLVVLALVCAVILAQVWSIRRRRRAAAAMDEIARQLGLIVGRKAGRDAEILAIEGRELVMRVKSETLRLSLEALIKIHLAHPPEKRVWHYEQLIAEAERKAREES